MSNIDSQLNDAILDAVGRYAGEMQDRFDTDGDPSLTNRPLWNAQVAAATNMLESELRLEIEQAFQRVNDLLDGGDFMASGEVVITQAFLRKRELEANTPGIVPLEELCKVPNNVL